MKFKLVEHGDPDGRCVATFEWSKEDLEDCRFDALDMLCLNSPVDGLFAAAQNVFIIATKCSEAEAEKTQC